MAKIGNRQRKTLVCTVCNEENYRTNKNVKNTKLTEEYASKIRASYYFMGSLLGKYGHVEISFPGGCVIGARPIDLHLKGFEALGAEAFGAEALGC